MGALSSQLRGDCQEVHCLPTGEVITVTDPGDVYNDGEQCTMDICDETVPRNDAWEDGTPCPESSFGVCHGGECVQCWDGDHMNNCLAGYGCDGSVCVPLHCVNDLLDGGETDYDCGGGACRPCPPGHHCAMDADCRDGICTMGFCKAPTCSDGVHNDAETGIDCGAPSCPRCGPGQGCRTAADCASGVCWAGACEAPTCYDGVRNDNEAGVDCGPACQNSCP